ncbi:hypothetical protein N0V93_001793 [Gnomoniopsis smithogilvyi]|uniref:Uncharacterized protein n=1 Tax=Gnomoniopsis smithogilvyi TaxID=1191159 RepID=A0A9W9D1J5_9PEZI|nr:hypothetical protein N0V93_001793 [Gnomoniopsis smithogilvyi]
MKRLSSWPLTPLEDEDTIELRSETKLLDEQEMDEQRHRAHEDIIKMERDRDRERDTADRANPNREPYPPNAPPTTALPALYPSINLSQIASQALCTVPVVSWLAMEHLRQTHRLAHPLGLLMAP